MSATNYQACLTETLKWEGGYSNDPGDPGGPTNFGITIADVRKYLKADASAADVRALTLDQAKQIYRKHYWEPVSGDVWPDGLDLSVFDAAVNSGVGRADDWARYAMATTLGSYDALANFARSLSDKVAAIKRYNAKRSSFLHSLKTWAIFGKGWGRRVAGIEALSVKMVLAAAGLSPTDINGKLNTEATKAKTASKTSATTATGTGAAGTGAATQVPVHHIDFAHGLLMAAGVALVVIVIVYFVHQSIQNRNRAAAYAAAASGATQ